MAFVLVQSNIQAQNNSTSSDDLSMGEGKVAISIGVGVPYWGRYHHFYRGLGYSGFSTPTIILQGEYGLTEKIPQSILGVGGFVAHNYSYNSWHDKYSVDYWERRYTRVVVAAKVYYHHKFLVGAKWDVYAAAMVGVSVNLYSFRSNDAYYYGVYDYTVPGVWPYVGAIVGGRYYFTKNFGVYGEVGYGASYAQAGFNFKF